jgi:hypothetical protein
MTMDFPRHKLIRTCGAYTTYGAAILLVPPAAVLHPAAGVILFVVAAVVMAMFAVLPDVAAHTNGIEVEETLIGWAHTSELRIAKSGKKAVITVKGHYGPFDVTLYGDREQFEALARMRASWCEVAPVVRGQGPYRG